MRSRLRSREPKKCATSSRAFYNILQARTKGNIPLCVYARALGRRVSALANSVPTGSAPRVAFLRIPLTSLVRALSSAQRKEENIPAQSYRIRSMTFPNKQNVKSIIRRIPSARTLECSFSRNGRNDARSTNDDDALVDSRATHVTDPGRASSRSLNRDPSVHEVRHEKAAASKSARRPYTLLADPTTEIIILADILANVRMQFYLLLSWETR